MKSEVPFLISPELWPLRAKSAVVKTASERRDGAIIDSMRKVGRNQLVVRNIEEEVVRALKLTAARHGRSAEAEHREILRQALLPAKDRRPLKELLLGMPDVGEDTDFERVVDLGREVEL